LAKNLAEIALEAGLVSKADAARAARVAEQRGVPLVTALVRVLGADELALVAALRRQLRVPISDPASVRADPEAMRELPREVCRRLKVLPIALSSDASGVRVMQLAMADPTDDGAVAEIEQLTACELDITVLPLSAIEELTENGYRGLNTEVVRARRPFGDGVLSMHTPMHVPARPSGFSNEPPDVTDAPATVPHHSLADEADALTRVRALVQVLVAKNVLREDEYEDAVRALLRRRLDDT
jgi:hypothetical protein